MNGINGRNARAIVLAIAALMFQNSGSYVAWSEMWPWQQALTVIAWGIIAFAIAMTYRGKQ